MSAIEWLKKLVWGTKECSCALDVPVPEPKEEALPAPNLVRIDDLERALREIRQLALPSPDADRCRVCYQKFSHSAGCGIGKIAAIAGKALGLRLLEDP